MFKSQYKFIFYAFAAFIMLIISGSFLVKNDSQFVDSSMRDQIRDEAFTGEKKNQEELLPKEIAPQEGIMAPDFTFPDLNGKSVSLSQFRGKIVFLNIWATWCGPCRIEMPDMEKLYRKFKKEDFVILAVSIDRQGESIVKPFVRELGLSFPILLSPEANIQRLYMVSALPSSFIIDKTGRIVLKATGARDWFGTETIETFEYLIHKT